MTVEQRKIQLINSITSLDNEALLIRMEEVSSNHFSGRITDLKEKNLIS